jgi:hypothetical protein
MENATSILRFGQEYYAPSFPRRSSSALFVNPNQLTGRDPALTFILLPHHTVPGCQLSLSLP